MLTIYVCDDEVAFADLLEEKLKLIFAEYDSEAKIVSFRTPVECLRAVRYGEPSDAVFLDIDMPGVSGFDIAKEIKKERRDALVVFVSGKPDLVFESFDYHPFSFVRKSAGDDLDRELRKVCEGVVSYLGKRKPIEVRDVYAGPVFEKADNILFVSSAKHYVEYHALDRDRPIKQRGTLKEAEKLLRPFGFIKPHSRFLVNAAHIGFFNPKINRIVLDTKESVPVSRSLRDSAYGEYLKIKRGF